MKRKQMVRLPESSKDLLKLIRQAPEKDKDRFITEILCLWKYDCATGEFVPNKNLGPEDAVTSVAEIIHVYFPMREDLAKLEQ